MTVVTIILAIVVKGEGVITTVGYWGDGFWDLLEFTTQMAMILAAGYVLTQTPIVNNLLNKIVSNFKTPKMAIIVTTFVSSIGFLINWGFGLIIGGIIAQKFSTKIKNVHYPLIISAGFSGWAFYGLGLSGSVPLVISTPNHFLEDDIDIIPLSETIFSTPMLLTTLALLITLPFINALLHPKNSKEIIEINISDFSDRETQEDEKVNTKNLSWASRLYHSKFVGIFTGLLGVFYLIIHFYKGGTLDINIVNFLMIFLGILFMQRPSAYLNALGAGIKLITGIMLQYPFYAGIMGVLAASGLVFSFSDFFVAISSIETLPFWSLISGFIVNILAPSGGGQWSVQGPIMVQAAHDIGTSIPKTAMGVQLGDAWNTVIQPFWLIPILALSKLSLKHVMGHLIIISVWVGVIFVTSFLLWGYVS